MPALATSFRAMGGGRLDWAEGVLRFVPPMEDDEPALSARIARARGLTRLAAREWLLPSSRMPRRWWPPALGLVYIAAIGMLGGLRGDHVLVGLLGLLDLYNKKTRALLAVFFPFMLTGIVYDSMRYYYWQGIEGHVHVAAPYLLERDWFGVGGRTLNEVFAAQPSVALDLACGFAYLTYVGELLAAAFLLFLRRRFQRAGALAWSFLLVNLMGFATYFVYPSAPPWYVAEYGLGPARLHIPPAAAAAHRFDVLLGTHFFDAMYGRGVDVFGALPSLHVAYPFLVAFFAFRTPELKWARWPAVGFFALMCLGAVYLQHHYVIDEILGVTYAVITLALVTVWERWRAAPA
jgi:inositol phosphorylceramide synthase catalytic subunit